MSEKRRVTLKTLVCFLALNAILTLLLGYRYILQAPGVEGWLGYGFLHLAFLSNFCGVYLAVALILGLLVLLAPGRRALFGFALPLLLGLHLLTFADVSIYRIFKFHINAMVLNLFQTEGAWDSVHLGALTLITTGAVMIAFIGFEALTLNALYQRFTRRNEAQPARFPKRTHLQIAVALMLALILADKATYAVADFYNLSQITRHQAVLPLYWSVTVKRFLAKYFHAKVDREENLALTGKTSPLNYPKAALERQPLAAYPNIIWIVIDAWRFDMFNAQVSPQIWKFARQAAVFTNHYSGGNASRFGIFSLFYGVYAYYWHQFLAARQSPVWIDELLNLGYDFRILSSTVLTYPEFRKTAFIKIPDAIDDRLPGQNTEEKDQLLARHFMDWLANRHSAKPFFAFLFFDAPHGPYSYPPQFEKFTPSMKTANYITVGAKDMIPLKNSYQNAIDFDDALTGQILAALEKKGFFENTIILITADHGEEFYENGYLGHTSAFTQYQTHVPLILYLPGQPPQEITRLTSHLDVAPTLLARLGYTSPPALYSQGRPLFEDRPRDFVVSCGWDNCGLISPPNTIVFATETYNAYLFDVRDAEYKLIADYKPLLNRKYGEILQVIKGFSEFNK